MCGTSMEVSACSGSALGLGTNHFWQSGESIHPWEKQRRVLGHSLVLLVHSLHPVSWARQGMDSGNGDGNVQHEDSSSTTALSGVRSRTQRTFRSWASTLFIFCFVLILPPRYTAKART